MAVEEVAPKPRLKVVPPVQPEIVLREDMESLRREMAECMTKLSHFVDTFAQPRPSGDPGLLDTLVAAFTGLGYALSSRALLLLALLGCFVLGLRAHDTPSLIVLMAFAMWTVPALVMLELKKVR